MNLTTGYIVQWIFVLKKTMRLSHNEAIDIKHWVAFEIGKKTPTWYVMTTRFDFYTTCPADGYTYIYMPRLWLIQLRESEIKHPHPYMRVRRARASKMRTFVQSDTRDGYMVTSTRSMPRTHRGRIEWLDRKTYYILYTQRHRAREPSQRMFSIKTRGRAVYVRCNAWRATHTLYVFVVSIEKQQCSPDGGVVAVAVVVVGTCTGTRVRVSATTTRKAYYSGRLVNVYRAHEQQHVA